MTRYNSYLNATFYAETKHSLSQSIANYLPLQQEPIDEFENFAIVMKNKNLIILDTFGKFAFQKVKRRKQEPPYNNAEILPR